MQYKRSLILINKPFQYRFALYVCSWTFAMSLIYPLIIYSLYDYFMKYMALDPHGPTMVAIQSTKSQVVWLLVGLQLLFLAVTFVISIFLSHRIAGPLYKVNRIFKDVRDGNMKEVMRFRETDHFQELSVSYNQMMDSLKASLSRQINHSEAAIDRVESVLKTHPELAEPSKEKLEQALTALRELTTRTILK